jgi:hypothetical protein
VLLLLLLLLRQAVLLLLLQSNSCLQPLSCRRDNRLLNKQARLCALHCVMASAVDDGVGSHCAAFNGCC